MEPGEESCSCAGAEPAFYTEMCVWVDKLGNCVHVCECLHTQGGGVLVVAKHGFGMIIYDQHYNLLIS